VTDAERLLTGVREIIQREIYPVRQRIGALGLGNAFTEGRLSEQERLECWTLTERLLGATAILIELLGIDHYVGQPSLSSLHDDFVNLEGRKQESPETRPQHKLGGGTPRALESRPVRMQTAVTRSTQRY